MIKCKDCKYSKPEDGEIKRLFCSNEHFVYDPWNEREKRADDFEYWDYESYLAGFSVGPDFGCIHAERAAGLTVCCRDCQYLEKLCAIYCQKGCFGGLWEDTIILDKMSCPEWQAREEKE